MIIPNIAFEAANLGSLPSDIDWDHPVFNADFSSHKALEHWVLEGGKSMQSRNDVLVLESEGAKTRPAQGNHLVAWLKQEIPGDFYLEFDFRPKNKQQGLTIIFFNTRGVNGESVFDPSLKPRDGTFTQYHSGDLNGYHISYWSGDRQGANLRKNKGFKLIASGDDPISKDQTDAFIRVGLYKHGGVIRCYINGQLALDHLDNGKSAGPAWNHSGWIGLRQMDHAHWAEYKNLTIYPVVSN